MTQQYKELHELFDECRKLLQESIRNCKKIPDKETEERIRLTLTGVDAAQAKLRDRIYVLGDNKSPGEIPDNRQDANDPVHGQTGNDDSENGPVVGI